MAPAWTPFLGFVTFLTVAVVGLAQSSAAILEREDVADVAIRANAVASQGLVAVLLLVGAWLAAIPLAAFGWRGIDPRSIVSGLAVGAGLVMVNEGLDRMLPDHATETSEVLRSRLAPATGRGWAGFLVVVLPTIAIAEELLFRGALLGVAGSALSLPVWSLVALSSIAFGAAHTAQGALGVIASAAFGALLAAAFVLTGDIVVVIVAHWLVDTAEFLRHEGPLVSGAG